MLITMQSFLKLVSFLIVGVHTVLERRHKWLFRWIDRRRQNQDGRRGCGLESSDDGQHEKLQFIGESSESESWLFSTDFSWTQNARTSKRHVL